MLEKYESDREQLEIVGLCQLVPKDHLLRKIEAAINFDKVYEITERYYCKNNGRPAVVPVIASLES